MAKLRSICAFSGIILVQLFSCIYTIDAQTEPRRRPSIKDAIANAALSYMCRADNSRICSGNGQCRNGQCSCYNGYSGPFCSISEFGEFPMTSSTTETPQTPPSVAMVPACFAESDDCGIHGECQEGVCRCEKGWSGFRCELSMQGGFCEAYKECAECTALMEDFCPSICASAANFFLAFGIPTAPASFHRCKQRNAIHNCTYYYQVNRSYPNGQRDIAVRACVPEPDDEEEVTSSSPDTDDNDVNKSGNTQKREGGDGAGSRQTAELLTIVGAIVMLRAYI